MWQVCLGICATTGRAKEVLLLRFSGNLGFLENLKLLFFTGSGRESWQYGHHYENDMSEGLSGLQLCDQTEV